MKILILGGTRFLGRHITETLLAAGHTVSLFNRGQSPDELPPAVERLRGDRDQGAAGLAALADRTWDVCVDVSGYTARQVRPSAEWLRGKVWRYVYFSSVSVYGDPLERPVFETHPRLPPADEAIVEVNGDTYGPLKVACENIVLEIFGESGTLLRPQIVAGPHDPTGRFTYWAQRALQSGKMLAPGNGLDHLQVIDVRDLARFTEKVIENDISGSFNLAGPRLTWAKFLKILGAKDFSWVADQVLRSAGVTESELPLFRADTGRYSGLMQVSNDPACAAGLTLTDTETTIKDVRAWLQGRNYTPLLSPEREAELIKIARAGER